MALFIIFVLNILIICIAQMTENADAAVYKQGSSGSAVRQIQTRLKNWGYHDGSVDGIYDSKTTAAVRYFQRKNGLTVDGICVPDFSCTGPADWRREDDNILFRCKPACAAYIGRGEESRMLDRWQSAP